MRSVDVYRSRFIYSATKINEKAFYLRIIFFLYESRRLVEGTSQTPLDMSNVKQHIQTSIPSFYYNIFDCYQITVIVIERFIQSCNWFFFSLIFFGGKRILIASFTVASSPDFDIDLMSYASVCGILSPYLSYHELE